MNTVNKTPTVEITANWVNVTPALAEQWLKVNGGNRNVRQHKVNSFARAQQEGRWRQTHQGISFDENNALLDGQHRLMAIVKSGVTVRMLVTYGQPRDNMKVIDRGSIRSTADTLRILYGMDNSTQRAATARKVISMKRGYFSGAYTADDDEVQREVVENGEHYNWIFLAFRGHRQVSPVLAALAYAYPVAPEKVQEFAALIIEPANVPAGSIIFRAKEIADGGCSSRQGSGTIQMEIFRRMLRCIQAYLRNEKLKQVKDSDEGLRYFAKLRGDAAKQDATP